MSREKYDPRIVVLVRGVYPTGSVGGDCAPERNAFGPGTVARSSISIPDRRLHPYLGDVADGGTVVDLWRCNWGDVADVAIKGPMMDMDLAPHTIRRFVYGPDPKPTSIDVGGPPRSLDRVDLATWIELRRRIGARIGKRIGRAVHWEDGTTTPIPAESCRWAAHPMDDPPEQREGATAG